MASSVSWEEPTRAPDPSPTPTTFHLWSGAFVDGETAVLQVDGAPPGAMVYFLGSPSGMGSGPCPAPLGGACVDLLSPISLLGSASTDASGYAALGYPVSGSGYLVVQAVLLGAPGSTSNSLGRSVLPAGTGVSPGVDLDGDGFTMMTGDCDEGNAALNPLATDIRGDGIDQNCDGADGYDGDGDGFAAVFSGGSDCDDADPAVYPGDIDGDGLSGCDGDCDDLDASVSPLLADVCDGVDNDCSGQVDMDSLGVSTCGVVESFSPVPLDVLIVVDDSCSMAEEQTALSNVAGPFLEALAGISYHVGVVTTDLNDPSRNGKLVSALGYRWVEPSVGTGEAVLQAMMQPGTQGFYEEQGLMAAQRALGPLATTDNAGFQRADSELAVLFLSDEDDFSAIAPGDFTNFLLGLRPGGQRVTAHGLLASGSACAQGLFGYRYAEVIDDLGGLRDNVCLPDYSAFMREVAAEIGRKIELSHPADPSSIVVTVVRTTGQTVVLGPGQWSYDPSTGLIDLLVPLQAGDEVIVSYSL